MKSEFLKLAGVKTEKAFYKKYPTEAAFFKAHPEAKKLVPKAQTGIVQGMGENEFGIDNDYYSTFDQEITPIQMPSNLPGVILPNNNLQTSLSNLPGIQNTNPQIGPQSVKDASKTPDLGKLVGAGIGGFQAIKQQKKNLAKAQQMSGVTDLFRQASGLREEAPERRYVRPEDAIINPNQLFPTYGVGTNVIAKNGAEIQNTFAPNTLYDDLGYEPLNDDERIKQYQFGGMMSALGKGAKSLYSQGKDMFGQAKGMFTKDSLGDFATQGGLDKVSNMVYSDMNESGTAQIGGGIGEAAGTAIGGPIGGAVGKFAGQLIGRAVDPYQNKINKEKAKTQSNISATMINQGAMGLQNQYASYMEDGGLIPMMEQGGELQTHWGGYAEQLSQNPYMPQGGETIMFRGQSHDESDGKGNTGIGITYGDNPVEVERGEPATKIGDDLVVYGNLIIPFGEGKGKKFKNYVADLSKQENKHNKFIEKNTIELDELDVTNPFDKLKLNALQANISGANAKLQDIADKKLKAASLQNAINDTAEEFGIDADALAKGKVKFVEEELTPIGKNGLKMAKTGGSYDKEDIDTLIQSIASQKNIDPRVIQKLIGAESSYSTKAKSDKGASGIMQLSPAVAKQYGVEKILNSNKPEDIKKVINAGVDFYKTLLKQNNNDYILASAAYNGGQGAVDFVKEKLNRNNITGQDWVSYMAERRKSNPSKDKNAWQNETFNYVNKLHSDAISPIVNTPNKENVMSGEDPKKYKVQPKTKGRLPYTPRDASGVEEWQGKNYEDKWIPSVKKLLEDPKKRDEVISVLENNKGEYSKAIQNVLSKGKTPEEKAKLILDKGTDFKPGEFHDALRQARDIVEGNTPQGGAYNFVPGLEIIPKEMQFDYKLPKDAAPVSSKTTTTETTETPASKSNMLVNILNQALPYLRPSDAEALDPNQLLGEMYAMSSNQLEPVQAQTYQPDLITPYDISLQDILNENQADYRAQQRLFGRNAEAQAMLNAQKYAANQKVLGEQFRQNQAQRMGVYNQNINTLNDTKLKNIGILDNQYERQAQAKALTKATTQAALNSISSKYLQNDAANRKLQIYENLYNYRFDPMGRAINMNSLQQFNPSGSVASNLANLKDEDLVKELSERIVNKNAEGVVTGSKERTSQVKTKAKNGSIVKAMKNL